MKRVLVLSEKGGVGKSFVSANVIAPAMYVALKKKIKLAEIDASNYTTEFYKNSLFLVSETIAVNIDTQKVKDEDFLAFLESDIEIENSIEEKNIYKEIERAIDEIVKGDFNIIDVGANATIVFLNTLIKKHLISYFDYVFLVATTNINEISLSVKSYEILRDNNYDISKVFFVINKYSSSIEDKLKHFEYLTDNNTIRVKEFEEYNSKIMPAKLTIFDIVLKYKEEEQKKELDKYIKQQDREMIDKIANRLLLLNKSKLFYFNNDFKRLINLFK